MADRELAELVARGAHRTEPTVAGDGAEVSAYRRGPLDGDTRREGRAGCCSTRAHVGRSPDRAADDEVADPVGCLDERQTRSGAGPSGPSALRRRRRGTGGSAGRPRRAARRRARARAGRRRLSTRPCSRPVGGQGGAAPPALDPPSPRTSSRTRRWAAAASPGTQGDDVAPVPRIAQRGPRPPPGLPSRPRRRSWAARRGARPGRCCGAAASSCAGSVSAPRERDVLGYAPGQLVEPRDVRGEARRSRRRPTRRRPLGRQGSGRRHDRDRARAARQSRRTRTVSGRAAGIAAAR